MSGIYIPDMKMPKDCYECPLIKENKEINGFYDCIIIGKACALSSIHKDCPLVEVPNHGDLKDYDSIREMMIDKYERRKKTWDPFYAQGFLHAIELLDKAPVILKATK